jgi:polysaccharide export outer membrane protein
MKRVAALASLFAICCIAGFASSAPTDGTQLPVATNSLSNRAADARPQNGAGPTAISPISPDTPRTGPPPDGQAIPEDYKIGPQDLIEVQVYGIDGLRREVRVNSRGVISLALIGAVNVGGLTAQEAEERLTAAYEKDYLRNPQVSVFIKEFTSQRITVDGAVGHPGVFPIKGQTSLLQAIAIAGGGAAMSDLEQVLLFRFENGQRTMVKYDVVKIRKGELPDPILLNDDLVVVNRSAARAALKDSLFRDILDTLNPFSYMKP